MDFLLEEHGGVNIQVEDNTPMEEDDPMIENTIEDDGISVVNNVPKGMIEEDGIDAADQDDHDDSTSTSDNDDEDGLDISILEKVHNPYTKAPKQLFSLL